MFKNKNNDVSLNENDFLFELEDKVYLSQKYFSICFLSLLLFIVLVLKDFSLAEIMNSRRYGPLIIFISIPILLIEIFRLIYYIKFSDKYKIKFYKDYIFISKTKDVINIKNINSLSFVKVSLILGRGRSPSIFLILFSFFLIPLYMLPIFFSIFIAHRKMILNNLVFVMDNNELYGGICYEVLTNDDKEKVRLYFEKYLKEDLNSIKKRLYLLPKN